MSSTIRFRKKARIDLDLKPTWVILGATSIIAREFCHLVASLGHDLILVGRDAMQLNVIADDLIIRHAIACEVQVYDLSEDISDLLNHLQMAKQPLSLFLAHSLILGNDQLDQYNTEALVKTNALSTVLLIQAYLKRKQTQHQVIFLSSVAACRGRSKNSLYGGSKALVDIWLEGLQQQAAQTPEHHWNITIARLGFIDTVQTFGLPGIFYASPPKACAQACWRALQHKKPLIYHPFFWRFIMGIITKIPFFIYKRLKV